MITLTQNWAESIKNLDSIKDSFAQFKDGLITREELDLQVWDKTKNHGADLDRFLTKIDKELEPQEDMLESVAPFSKSMEQLNKLSIKYTATTDKP